MSKDKSPLVDLPVSVPTHSYADWSNDVLLTTNFGYLVPSFCRQLLPGTDVKWRSSHFGRLAPMLSPVYGKINIFGYRFTVRNRDIATYWDSLITNGDQRLTWQQNESSFVPPVISQFKPLDLLLNPYFKPNLFLEENNANYYFVPVNKRFTSGYSSYFTYVKNTYITPAVPNDSLLFDENTGKFSFIDTKMNYSTYILDIDASSVDINVSIRPTQSFDYFEKQHLYLFFRPNYSELTSESAGLNSVYYSNEYFTPNPFSSGCLMDYLGLDLKGFYIRQRDFFKRMTFFTMATSGPTMEVVDVCEKFVSEFCQNHYVHGIAYCFGASSLYAINMVSSLGYASSNLLDELDTYPNSTIGWTLTDFENYMTSIFYNEDETIWPDSNDRQSVNMLKIHAYNFVYNEWFRDQNLIPINPNCRFDVQGDFLQTFMSGNTMTLQQLITLMQYFHLRRKAWEKDLFTTALPGPQRGKAVRFLSDANVIFNPNHVTLGRSFTGSESTGKSGFKTDSYGIIRDSNNDVLNIDNTETLSVDLSQATIENFRWANKMQEFLEIKARTGNRYFEMMQGLWGVDIDDAKINRPIYMDGSKTPIEISEVLQTSSTDVATGQPLGDMAGRATAVGGSDYLNWFQKDWAFMLEIITVVPRVSYLRGLDKEWTRKQYLDWPWFKFAQLGEETVDKSELLFDGTTAERPFGYQSRYYDMKLVNDTVHGEFKDSLDFWHFGRDFDSYPQLGQSFIEVDTPYRQFAVTDKHYHHVWLSVQHDISVHQPLPHLPVPSL